MTYFTSVVEAANVFTSSTKGRQSLDDSFWICDLGETASLLQDWSLKMPCIRPFYAMKAAPHPDMIKVFLLEGAGIDCASKEEIKVALKLGAKPEDIIYSNPNKQISHLQFAKQNSVNLTVYDCEEELRKIHTHHPQAKLLLRIKSKTGKDEAYPLNERFGATSANSKRLLNLSNELGLQTIGISFHVGSPCRDKTVYAYALDEAKQIMEYASTLGIKCEMLDIGGGLEGTDYIAEHFEENSAVIRDKIQSMLSDSRFSQLQVIAEPGRYFAEPSFSLVANVIAKKEEDDVIVYTVNEGVSTSFFMIIAGVERGAIRNVIPLKDNSENGVVLRPSRLFGPSCAAFDLIADLNMIDLEIGDWVMWKECGTYTFSMGGNFNGFKTGVTYNVVTEKNRKYLSNKSLQYIASQSQEAK